jgi:cytochrome b
MKRILVWDLPVRLGHWLMVGGFALAWATGESESWRLVHVGAGATVVAVALFRVLWGVIGSRHARFADFVRGPAAVADYLAGMLRAAPPHHTGHNPAGALAIVALLALAIMTGASGWLTYQELGGEWLEEFHEAAAAAMLAVVVVHVGGVALGSVMHRENLVGAMFSGRKQGAATEAIGGDRPLAAVLLVLWVVAAAWAFAQ